MNDARLRESFATLPQGPVAHDGCPAPDRLWAAARGELARDERLAVLDHTTACAECALAWRLAGELVDAPARVSRKPRAVGVRWLVAAAALVIAVAGLQVLREPRLPPVYRAPMDAAVTSRLERDSQLPIEEFRLAWTPGPEGARCDVRVSDEDLAVVHRAIGVAATEVTVPPRAFDSFANGDRVLWQVDAVLPDGRPLPSETFSQRLVVAPR